MSDDVEHDLCIELPPTRSIGTAELVHAFQTQMPTGVTVTDDGRIFVTYPRWGDDVAFTVAELRDGEEVPYPNAEVNRLDLDRAGECLVSVQNVVVDPVGRLWLLDTGSIELGPTVPGGAKLVCVDLARDEIVATIHFPPDVAFPTTYLNDVRFDLRRGDDGIAIITDSGHDGPNGFVVADLASGRSWRKLTGHPTTRPLDDFVAAVEGEMLGLAVKMGLDGIALSADGHRVYYSPLASRRLYSVSLYALAHEDVTYNETAKTIVDLGEKGPSDGLESDAEGRVYASNYEQGGVICASPDGRWETVVRHPRMVFVDTLFLAADGHLYFTVNQLNRHPYYHDGKDLRERPFGLLRTPVDGRPVRLRR